MKISFVADVHVGNFKKLGGPFVAGVNRRCRQAVGALRRAAEMSVRSGSGVLVVAGDLFDYARPEPQVIAAVMDALSYGPNRIVILRGNHDASSDAKGDHALGPLARELEVADGRRVDVVDAPAVLSLPEAVFPLVPDVDLLLVPWQSGPAKDWLPDAVENIAVSSRARDRVLVIHLGVVDGNTPAFLQGHDTIEAQRLAEIMRVHGISTCFAGHHHIGREWRFGEQEITQIGTLAPTGFSDAGVLAGRVAHYDGKTVFSRVAGPRFLRVAHAQSAEVARVCAGAGNDVYVSVRADDSAPEAAVAQLDQLRKEGIVDGEVVISSEEQVIAARSAAAAVRAAGTLEEALAAYVNEMIVAGGVRKEDVLALCKKYLAVTGGGT